MKFKAWATALALAAGASTALHAAPTTLDMNSMGFDLSAGQTSQGFSLSSNGGFSFIGNSDNCWPACAHNGSNYIWSGAATIGLAQTAGGVFDLTSFQGAETHMGVSSIWASAIQVLGRYADGSTVSTQFTLDGINDGRGALDDFQTFFLPTTFSGLTSVNFSVAGGRYGQFALDNIVLNGSFQTLSSRSAPLTVPAPGTLALTGTALLALTAAVWSAQRRPR